MPIEWQEHCGLGRGLLDSPGFGAIEERLILS